MRPNFKAWDKVQKRWRKICAIQFDPESGGVEVEGKSYVDPITGEHDCEIDFLEWDQVELVDSTGLHDKNGKEIYEGDIYIGCLSDEPFVIKYDLGKFNIANNVLNSWYFESQRGEVIGNIYENPDLIRE